MKATISTATIDDHTAEKLLRLAQKFYSDPKNQRGFAAWQAEQCKQKGGKRGGKK